MLAVHPPALPHDQDETTPQSVINAINLILMAPDRPKGRYANAFLLINKEITPHDGQHRGSLICGKNRHIFSLSCGSSAIAGKSAAFSIAKLHYKNYLPGHKWNISFRP
jgi:hypothetical protein